MWLLYMRFDDKGEVKTYHVRTGSKADVLDLLALAEQHGLVPIRITGRLEPVMLFDLERVTIEE